MSNLINYRLSPRGASPRRNNVHGERVAVAADATVGQIQGYTHHFRNRRPRCCYAVPVPVV